MAVSLAEFLGDQPKAHELILPIKRLSATQIGMAKRCWEQFRQRYILERIEPPGAALVLGTGFHVAQEVNFSQKIESREDVPVDEVVAAFHHGFDRSIEEAGGIGEVVWDEREKPETVRMRGEQLARQYREQVSPKMQPASVEEWFNLTVEGVPKPVVGKIDFVGEVDVYKTANISVGRDSVVDYKTSSKSVSALKPDWRFQADLYQMAKRLPVEYHVAVKKKDPVIITPTDAPDLRIAVSDLAIETTQADIVLFARMLAWLWSEVGPDQPWPDAKQHPWACGTKERSYCGYRPTCFYWRHEYQARAAA